jgi:hypothetical protein
MFNAKILDLEVIEQFNNVGSTPIDFTRLFYMLYQDMDNLIRPADTKAQLVLGVNAVLVASSVQLAPGMAQSILDPNAALVERSAYLASLIMVVLLLASIFYALLTVIPQFKMPHVDQNLYFFGHITGLSEENFTQRFLNGSLAK